MSTLYENITLLCTEKGIKGGKLCTDIGISKSTLTSLKTGRRKGISTETAQKIADYFGVSVDRVLGTEQKEKPTPVKGEPEYDDMVLLDAFNRADEATKAAIRLLLKVQ